MLGSRIEFGELIELAGRSACVEEQVSLRDLPRLTPVTRDRLEDVDGELARLAAGIRFEEGPEGLPRVNLEISGNMTLECQRCLQPLGWELRIDSRLTILTEEGQAARLSDPFDTVLMDGEGLDLLAILEDEILAALPLAPVHESGSECAKREKTGKSSGIGAAKTIRPFENLASLMGRTEKHRSD